ncbi:MAG: type II and III secretion system protein family protein [Croceibacterium sp.]
MNSRLLKSALSAACALAPLAALTAGPADAQSVTKPAGDLVLSIGRGQLVTVPSTMTDIFVANDAVADVQVKSQRQLYIFGKSGGQTTVYASNGSGDVVWSANVRVGSNIDSIDQMLALAMPDAKVAVATMGTNTVLLTGTVAAPEDAAEAERLVKAFVGDGANVVSRLRMATPLQVNLRVRIAEVSRSLVRTLGVNLTSVNGNSGFKFGIGRGRALAPGQTFETGGPLAVGAGVGQSTAILADGTRISGPAVQTPPSAATIAGLGRFLGLDILGALDAGETAGLVTSLAEPNLTALSGETAEFLAGGEFPIPVSSGLGSTTIEYKKYGVSLAYTPTVLANGRISIRVRPEVSELSSQGAVTVNNFTIPALTTRRAETTVELGSGQSFMIGGLLSNNAQNTVQKLPGVGDLPIVGALFKSTEFRKGQTELVIVVTPYLVNPVDDSEIHLPTDGFQSPDAASAWLLNKDNAGVSGAQRPMPRSGESIPAAPQVGMNTPTAPRQDADKQRAVAIAPAPGFSLR